MPKGINAIMKKYVFLVALIFFSALIAPFHINAFNPLHLKPNKQYVIQIMYNNMYLLPPTITPAVDKTPDSLTAKGLPLSDEEVKRSYWTIETDNNRRAYLRSYNGNYMTVSYIPNQMRLNGHPTCTLVRSGDIWAIPQAYFQNMYQTSTYLQTLDASSINFELARQTVSHNGGQTVINQHYFIRFHTEMFKEHVTAKPASYDSFDRYLVYKKEAFFTEERSDSNSFFAVKYISEETLTSS